MLCHDLASAHSSVCQLIADFSEAKPTTFVSANSEARARISFIDKLWQALGWDVTHQQQKIPTPKRSKSRSPQKILGTNRRADYAFHTALNFRDVRFFCEAKKPHVQLRIAANSAGQRIVPRQ